MRLSDLLPATRPLVVSYSPQEAADLLGIPKSTVLTAIERDELPAIRYNARVFRITATDCAAWYASRGGRMKSTTSTSPTTTPPGAVAAPSEIS
jgi:excisionase family DNA binding protein